MNYRLNKIVFEIMIISFENMNYYRVIQMPISIHFINDLLSS